MLPCAAILSQRRLVGELTSLYGPSVLGGAHLWDAVRSFFCFLVGCENTHHMLLAPRLLVHSPLPKRSAPVANSSSMRYVSPWGLRQRGTRIGGDFWCGRRVCSRHAHRSQHSSGGPQRETVGSLPLCEWKVVEHRGSYLVKLGTTIKKVHVC